MRVVREATALDAEPLGQPRTRPTRILGVALVYLDRLDHVLVDALHRVQRLQGPERSCSPRAAKVAQLAFVVLHDVLAVKMICRC